MQELFSCGHPKTRENTYQSTNPYPRCRTCFNEYMRDRRRRAFEALRAQEGAAA